MEFIKVFLNENDLLYKAEGGDGVIVNAIARTVGKHYLHRLHVLNQGGPFPYDAIKWESSKNKLKTFICIFHLYVRPFNIPITKY